MVASAQMTGRQEPCELAFDSQKERKNYTNPLTGSVHTSRGLPLPVPTPAARSLLRPLHSTNWRDRDFPGTRQLRGESRTYPPATLPLTVASEVPGRLRRAPGRNQRAAGRRRNGRPRRRDRLRWCHRRPHRAASRRRASRAAPGTHPGDPVGSRADRRGLAGDVPGPVSPRLDRPAVAGPARPLAAQEGAPPMLLR